MSKVAAGEPSKACTVCKVVQPLSAYQRQSSAPDGRAWRCKTCASAYAKAPSTKARVLARVSAYYRTPDGKAKKEAYRSKQVQQVTGSYARALIAGPVGLSRSDIPDDIAELKRQQTMASRALKELGTEIATQLEKQACR